MPARGAVTALGRRPSLPGQIQVRVQSESLFNDAASMVLFKVAVAGVVAAGSVGIAGSIGMFFVLADSGIAAAPAVAAAVALLRTRAVTPVLDWTPDPPRRGAGWWTCQVRSGQGRYR